MKPFNLAEQRIVERNYCRTHINRRLRVSALMIVATMLICGLSYTCKAMFAGEVSQTRSKLAEAQARCADAKREIEELNKHAYERKWQAQLAAESGRWLDVLNSVIARVPSDVWLDSVKNAAAESKVSISGRAASFDAIAEFINALRYAKEYGEVTLESARAAGNTDVNCVDFTLSAAVEEGSAAQASTPAAPADKPAQPATAPEDRGQPEPARGGVPNLQGSG